MVGCMCVCVSVGGGMFACVFVCESVCVCFMPVYVCFMPVYVCACVCVR
jgi:hypothetical protein